MSLEEFVLSLKVGKKGENVKGAQEREKGRFMREGRREKKRR